MSDVFDYKYTGKIGKTFRVGRDPKVLPNSRWKTTDNGLLIPKIYLNVSYSKPSGDRDGRLRVWMMRENPDDSTFWFDLILPRGYDKVLETKTELKYWSAADVGRNVHFEAKVYGVSTCYLNATSYVSYAIIKG